MKKTESIQIKVIQVFAQFDGSHRNQGSVSQIHNQLKALVKDYKSLRNATGTTA